MENYLDIKKDFKKLLLNFLEKLSENNLLIDHKYMFKYFIKQNDDYYTELEYELKEFIPEKYKENSNLSSLKYEMELQIIEDTILVKIYRNIYVYSNPPIKESKEFEIEIPYKYYNEFSEENYNNLSKYINEKFISELLEVEDYYINE